MIKTQVQLPDALYREAKRVAEERELSLAEVLRRGVEYIVRTYPPLGARRSWSLPRAVHATLRPGVTMATLRDLAAGDEEPNLLGKGKRIRTGRDR
jgi:hypothetical protein